MTTLTWTSAAGGLWSSASNWTSAQVPIPADTVMFDGSGASLSFVSDTTVAALTMTDPLTLITATGTLEVRDTTAIQAGTLAISNAGHVLLDDLMNTGSITIAANGWLGLTGTYGSDDVERIFASGGSLSFQGTMLNTGKVFDASVMGTVTVDDLAPAQGTIVGGTILGNALGANVLDDVVWEGTLLISGRSVLIHNDLTVVATGGGAPGTIDLDGSLTFADSTTFDNVVVLQDTAFGFNDNVIRAHETLTLGAQATVAVTGGTFNPFDVSIFLSGTDADSRIINHGTLESRTDLGRLRIDVASFQNHGVVSATGPQGIGSGFTISGDSFVNETTGLLRVVGGTMGRIDAAIGAATDFVNNGSIFISNGSLAVGDFVGGAGTILVQDNGTIDINGGGAAGQTISLNVSGMVDLAIPELFQGTITGLTMGTSLRLDSVATAIGYTDNVLTMRLGGGQTFGLNILGSLTLEDFIVNSGTANTTITTDLPAPCFAAGTMIRTEAGDIAVESLRAGDRIHIASDGMAREIVWIGHREVDCAHHPDPAAVWPVRVVAGAFGPSQPARDLYLSPDHAIFFQDSLIPVKHLLNGTTIARVPMDHVSYYHIELATHAVILAEGLAVESYLDTGDRDSFANAGPSTRLFPVFGGDPNLIRDARACAPLVVTGPVLAAARAVTTRPRSAAA